MSQVKPITPFKADDGKEYYVLWCSPLQSDVIGVTNEFAGRDRRRRKREMRRLFRRHRLGHEIK